MMFGKFSAAAAAVSLFLATGTEAGDSLPAIEIKGNKFFFSNNGTQFFMRGVAYQANSANATDGSQFTDPLGDYSVCSRDIPYLQKLRTNVIRVYALDHKLDHSKCMKALDEAGIYVIADLSEPGLSVNRESPSWTIDLYKRYTSVVDELQKYSNVLGFFAGNEVTNDNTNTDASAFVKAAVRDTKSYIKAKGYRKIPVGYSSNDDKPTRNQITDYFACGKEDDESRADFFGINMYEWCGESTFQKSGFADRTKEFSRMTIPVFFSEYGCNEVTPRKFTEVAALYSKDMTDVWSGGIVYMYFEEENKYGLVKADGDKVSTLPDFNYYSSQIAKINPTGVNSKDYSPTGKLAACPTKDTNWQAATELPPTPDGSVCSCMAASLSCVVKDSVEEEKYSDLFSFLCDKGSCDGILANGTTGAYGGYSFCSPKDKLSFVMDLYYKKNGQSDKACDFSGAASIRKPEKAETKCAGILSSIGSLGLGKLSATSLPTPEGSGADSPNTLSSVSSHTSKNGSIPSIPLYSPLIALISLIGMGFIMG